MRTRLVGLDFVGLFVLLLLAACGGGGSGDDGSSRNAGNLAPLAVAGAAQSVVSGAAVDLDGNGSRDFDGTIAAFKWSQVSGAAVTLAKADSAKATFVAPQVNQVSTLT